MNELPDESPSIPHDAIMSFYQRFFSLYPGAGRIQVKIEEKPKRVAIVFTVQVPDTLSESDMLEKKAALCDKARIFLLGTLPEGYGCNQADISIVCQPPSAILPRDQSEGNGVNHRHTNPRKS